MVKLEEQKSDLERQLKTLTKQIKVSRRPGVSSTILLDYSWLSWEALGRYPVRSPYSHNLEPYIFFSGRKIFKELYDVSELPLVSLPSSEAPLKPSLSA